MKKVQHVAFVLESVYGHIVPTVGIATELIHRGYRVSYAVKKLFESKISGIGAEAHIYQPLENKLKLFQEMKEGGSFHAPMSPAAIDRILKFQQEETEDTLAKVMRLYEENRPDLIVYDCANPAGRLLGRHLDIPAIEHSPMVISKNPFWSYDEQLVLVSVPKFFQKGAEELGANFQFIGFVQNDRTTFFAPWHPRDQAQKIILVNATTGLLPQVDFFKTAIAAFSNSPWQVVLTIGDDIDPGSLGPLPANCELNRSFANFEILKSACLVVGQAGQGSTLEALYHGVPQILIPPSEVHAACARRIAELELGACLEESEATPETLKIAALSALQDSAMHARLKNIAKTMRENNGAARAADLISQRLIN